MFPLPLSELQAAFAASLGSLVVGFTSAWSSPAIASLQKEGSRYQKIFSPVFGFILPMLPSQIAGNDPEFKLKWFLSSCLPSLMTTLLFASTLSLEDSRLFQVCRVGLRGFLDRLPHASRRPRWRPWDPSPCQTSGGMVAESKTTWISGANVRKTS